MFSGELTWNHCTLRILWSIHFWKSSVFLFSNSAGARSQQLWANVSFQACHWGLNCTWSKITAGHQLRPSGWGDPHVGPCAATEKEALPDELWRWNHPLAKMLEELPAVPLGRGPMCPLLASVLTQNFFRKGQFQNLRMGHVFVS